MFIQTELTPNPATVKFIPDQPVLTDGGKHFSNVEDASVSPLATRLFGFDYVTAVFLGLDFISVTLDEDGEWADTKPMILGAIMDHYTSGLPVMEETTETIELSEEDSDIVRQIKAILDEKVRPSVAQDGGDIVFESYADGVVSLHLRGACAGCPSASMTLKSGVENLLKYYIPEVTEVRAAM
jgi:Fe-S cluster biogenesis protein NfuA